MGLTGGAAVKYDVSPHHQADNLLNVGACNLIRTGVTPILKHRETVTELEHFVQAVGDIDNAHTTAFQFPYHAMQAFDFAVAECCRRLIHDNELRVQGQRPGDLYHLLLRDTQARHRRGG